MNVEGAKKARSVIKIFHRQLNSAGLLPSQTYMPPNIGFVPVCVINQIVALFISHNYERIPGLISFAFKHFPAFDTKPVYGAYKIIAFDYLCQVSYFLSEFTEQEKAELERVIPSAIYLAGPKEPPNYFLENEI
ncbi:MAG: hypothetical protein V4732_12225 [Pseudomonadota bacterium]